MTHLIVGYGEVGRGLHEIIPSAETLDVLTTPKGTQFDVLHICLPCTSVGEFTVTVRVYQDRYKPLYTVVHSTVPIGTTRMIENAVHSPIRGAHPYLAEGMRVFPKYFGGPMAFAASAMWESLGLQSRCYLDSRLTEALKLWDTTQYGWMIVLEKEMYQWCADELPDLEPEEVMKVIYMQANQDYNDGYVKLGRPEVVRPFLRHVKGPIGGHCVIPNTGLLRSSISSLVRGFNDVWKRLSTHDLH